MKPTVVYLKKKATPVPTAHRSFASLFRLAVEEAEKAEELGRYPEADYLPRQGEAVTFNGKTMYSVIAVVYSTWDNTLFVGVKEIL